MSRVARKPVELPKGVEVTPSPGAVRVKGPKGELSLRLGPAIEVTVADGKARVSVREASRQARASSGTARALLANMVTGVTKGFERKLELVGVGYRAQAQGRKLNLTLGFSHPVNYPVPEGITIETPSQTEIIIKGSDRQKVGQVAAEIRGFRPPEPYKGKGVRHANEQIVLKEAKKK
jgi:large subunit ribosomal protein L6